MSNKIKKKSTFIDMTAMSDVTVLLLCFFMLTSTFIQKEPVRVNPPMSVSEIKILEFNVVSIMIEQNGKVFMSLDKPQDRMDVLRMMGENYQVDFTEDEIRKFSLNPSFGVNIHVMKQFLALSPERQDEIILDHGIPCDSTDNQFKSWIQFSKLTNKDLTIAIKADASTPYPVIKDIMNTLQELREQRYNLITSLRDMPAI